MTEPETAKPNHVPLISILGGALMILVFGLFMLTGYPPSRSIIPPVGIAAGVILILGGLIAQMRRRHVARQSQK